MAGEIVLNHESTDFVADNASVFYFDEKDPYSGNEFLLRLFALVRGYSCPAGIPGHYLSAATTGEGEDSAVGVIEAPAIITFIDEGMPAKLCIAFRKYNSTKICAKALDMPLQISGGAQEKFYKWKEAGSVKLDVIKSFIPLARSDGYNMVKELASWIKSSPSSNPFRDLKLLSVKDIRAWLAAGRYSSKNVDLICNAAVLRARKQVKDASGAQRAEKRPATSAAAQEAQSVELQEVDRRVQLIEVCRAQMKTLSPFYDAPLGARLIECALPPAEQDGLLDISTLKTMIERESSQEIAKKLIEIVEKQEIVKIIAAGDGAKLPFASPFLALPAPAPAPAATSEEDPLAAARKDLSDSDSDDSDDSASNGSPSRARKHPPKQRGPHPKAPEADPETGTRASKRSRAEPKRLDLGGDTKGKKEKVKEKEKKPRRSYTKSGIYSKDPVRAAHARMQASGMGTPSSESGGLHTPTPAGEPPHLHRSRHNLIHCVLVVCRRTSQRQIE